MRSPPSILYRGLCCMQAEDIKAGSDAMKAFVAVAKEYKGKVIFVTVNSEGESSEPVTNFFGLKEAAAPAVSHATPRRWTGWAGSFAVTSAR